MESFYRSRFVDIKARNDNLFSSFSGKTSEASFKDYCAKRNDSKLWTLFDNSIFGRKWRIQQSNPSLCDYYGDLVCETNIQNNWNSTHYLSILEQLTGDGTGDGTGNGSSEGFAQYFVDTESIHWKIFLSCYQGDNGFAWFVNVHEPSQWYGHVVFIHHKTEHCEYIGPFEFLLQSIPTSVISLYETYSK